MESSARATYSGEPHAVSHCAFSSPILTLLGCFQVEDRFRILRHLGRGSYTEAYLAEDVMGARKANVRYCFSSCTPFW